MVFKILLPVICSLFYLVSSAQYLSLKPHTYTIESISPQNKDFSDLQVLKERIGDANVVMLGEQTHGDGATLEAKARIVQFLHQEMGFDVLAFEGEMFGLMKTEEAIKKGEDPYDAFKQSLYWIWSNTEEFRPVMDYIADNITGRSPLTLTGFDVQNGSEFMAEKFIPELNDFLVNSMNVKLEDEFFLPLEILIAELAGGDFKNYTSDDSLLFFKTFNMLQKEIAKAAFKTEFKTKAIIWEHLLNNLLLDLQGWLNYRNGIIEVVQNSRDKAMAENLLFLRKLYPDKKIICWGASFHFAKSWHTIETGNETTKSYLKKISTDQNSPEYDLDEMSKAVTMGEILADSIGNDLYSLAFTSYTGSYSFDTIRQVYPAPKGSIEHNLFNLGFEYAYVDLSKAIIPANEKLFFAGPEGYIPFKADWQKMFDGIFFICEMYPSTKLIPEYGIKNQQEQTQTTYTDRTTLAAGRIINETNKEPVPFVNIGLKGKSTGTASNENGLFELKIPGRKLYDTIQISAIGFKRKEIALKEFVSDEVLNIELIPGTYLLDEFIVKAKGLSPRKIVKKAIKNIRYNYAQTPYSLDLYYRLKYFKKDTVHFLQEAALELYDSEGFQKSTWRSLIRNKNLRLTHYRPSNNKHKLRPWHIWVYWSHDYILTRGNPFSLQATLGYSYKLEEVIPSEDSDIYKISFNCTKKSNYFTGWGSPDSLSGFLYIKQKDYALVKYAYHLETSWVLKNGDSIRTINNVTHSYRNFSGSYFHDFIKDTSSKGRKDSKTGEWAWYDEDIMLLTTEIHTRSPKVFTEKMIEFKTNIPYNKTFWDNFNLIPER